MPSDKVLANPPKPDSRCLWSISFCQKREDIQDIAEYLSNCQQFISVKINLPVYLERFNILADVVFSLEQKKEKIEGISEDTYCRINELLANVKERWNDADVESILLSLASSADIQRLCTKKEELFLQENARAMELIARTKIAQRVSWREIVSQESFDVVFSQVVLDIKNTPTLSRSLSGAISNWVKKTYNSSTNSTRRLLETISKLYLLEEATWRIFAGNNSEHEYEVYYGSLPHVLLEIYRKNGGNSFTMKFIQILDRPKEQAAACPPTPTHFSPVTDRRTFFNQSGQRILEQEQPAYSLTIKKANHVWSVECDMEFADGKRDAAIKFLLTSIDAAKKDYEAEGVSGGTAGRSPIVLGYSRQLIGFRVSYRIEMRDHTVMTKINPFDILIRDIRVASEQDIEFQQEIAAQKTTHALPQSEVVGTI